jgi:hypothetical protein
MRDKNNFLTKESVKDIRGKISDLEVSYPGLKLIAVETVEDVILWGDEYMDSLKEE